MTARTCAAAVLASFGLAAVAPAATWHVSPDGLGDAPTIQAAINVAAFGDTVEVACGTYYESQITMGNGIVVTSETGGPDCVTVDAEGDARVFACRGVGGLTALVGLTITGGRADFGGGVLCEGTFVHIENCDITGNTAANGGGLYLLHSSPTITSCVIRDNTALAWGGGMVCYDNSIPVVSDCTFTGNVAAESGGGIWCFFRGNPALTDCRIAGNSSGFGGGALECIDAFPTLTRCVITGNEAAFEGGAMRLLDSGPTLTQCTVAGNRAVSSAGGGFLLDGSSLSADGTILWGNCAPSGEEAYLASADSWIEFGCSDVDTAGASFGGPGLATWTGVNVATDPLFCGAEACIDAPTTLGEYGLREGSAALSVGGSCGMLGGIGPGASCNATTSPPGTAAPLAARIFPNPFRTSTTIALDVPESALGDEPAAFHVYDVSGRLVRTLEAHAGTTNPPRQVSWDGRDQSGERLHSGVYFCRVEAGPYRASARMVLLQ